MDEKVEIEFNPEGWFSVIEDGECIAAFKDERLAEVFITVICRNKDRYQINTVKRIPTNLEKTLQALIERGIS